MSYFKIRFGKQVCILILPRMRQKTTSPFDFLLIFGFFTLQMEWPPTSGVSVTWRSPCGIASLRWQWGRTYLFCLFPKNEICCGYSIGFPLLEQGTLTAFEIRPDIIFMASGKTCAAFRHVSSHHAGLGPNVLGRLGIFVRKSETRTRVRTDSVAPRLGNDM